MEQEKAIELNNFERGLVRAAERFGKSLAALAWIPSFAGTYDFTPPYAEVRLQQEQISKEAIEQQFNIKLYTLREDFQRQGRDYPEANPDFANVPMSWEVEHLIVLKKALEILPPHFYQPLPDGTKMEIILSFVNHSRDTDSLEAVPYQIELDYRMLKFESQKDALEGIAHEQTHASMPKMVIFLPNPALPGIYLTEPQIESPWFSIIDDILGGKYQEVAPDLRFAISEKKKNTSQEQVELHKFYQDLLWGLNRGEDPYELIAYMAQHHLYGKDWMFQRYGEIFSQDQLDKLYAFTTNQIYQGREYLSFPLT